MEEKGTLFLTVESQVINAEMVEIDYFYSATMVVVHAGGSRPWMLRLMGDILMRNRILVQYCIP